MWPQVNEIFLDIDADTINFDEIYPMLRKLPLEKKEFDLRIDMVDMEAGLSTMNGVKYAISNAQRVDLLHCDIDAFHTTEKYLDFTKAKSLFFRWCNGIFVLPETCPNLRLLR